MALASADALEGDERQRHAPERREAARRLLLRALTLPTMTAPYAMAIQCLLEFERCRTNDYDRQAEALCGAAETLEKMAADLRALADEQTDPALDRMDRAVMRSLLEQHVGLG
jgi:hypothetical protein